MNIIFIGPGYIIEKSSLQNVWDKDHFERSRQFAFNLIIR